MSRSRIPGARGRLNAQRGHPLRQRRYGGQRSGCSEGSNLIRRGLSCITIALLGAAAVGCTGKTTIEKVRQAMYDQPKYQSLEASSFFADGRSSRHPVRGTVARGQLSADEHFYSGKVDGTPVASFPYPITAAHLDRGRERFGIFCAPCHDRSGSGNGLMVQRGMKQPPSFHTDRLRNADVGHLYDVISNGFGTMYSYGSRIPPKDRWAITAYIRVLQLSQHATLDDVPDDVRAELEARK